MGSMPDLKSAQALAELHLLTPQHQQVDRTVIAELGFLIGGDEAGRDAGFASKASMVFGQELCGFTGFRLRYFG